MYCFDTHTRVSIFLFLLSSSFSSSASSFSTFFVSLHRSARYAGYVVRSVVVNPKHSVTLYLCENTKIFFSLFPLRNYLSRVNLSLRELNARNAAFRKNRTDRPINRRSFSHFSLVYFLFALYLFLFNAMPIPFRVKVTR